MLPCTLMQRNKWYGDLPEDAAFRAFFKNIHELHLRPGEAHTINENWVPYLSETRSLLHLGIVGSTSSPAYDLFGWHLRTGFKILLQGLKANSTLLSLDLERHYMQTDQLSALFSTLAANSKNKLRELNWFGNIWDSDAWSCLMEFLPSPNCHIKWIRTWEHMPGNMSCSVCMKGLVKGQFFPCKHASVCVRCAKTYETCPTCWNPSALQSLLVLYFPSVLGHLVQEYLKPKTVFIYS